MFKKTAIIVGIGMAVSAAAQAQQEGEKLQEAIVTGDHLVDTYRWEINAAAGVTNYDWDHDDGDVDKYGIRGSFFLNPVDTTKGPRSEAAFLDHASSVSLEYVYTDADDLDILPGGEDADTYQIDGRYVLDLDSIPLIFEGSFARMEPDDIDLGSTKLELDVDTYTLGFGAYITDTTTVMVTYMDRDVDADVNNRGDLEDEINDRLDDSPGDTDGWQLGLEHVWTWSGGGLKLGGNVGYINVDNGDDIDVYNIAATWYITDDFGLGITTGYTDLSNNEILSTDIFAEWFITRNIALSALVGYAETDDDVFTNAGSAEVERTRGVIGATFRF